MARWIIAALLTLLVTSACSAQQKPAQQQNYQDTKAMVMDIVNSDQFKEQLSKTMKNPDFQAMSAIKDPEFKQVVIEVFKDPEFKKTLVNQIRDTEFKNELKKVLKEILQEPDMKKLLQSSGGQSGGGGGGGGSSSESSGGGGGSQ